MKSCRQKDMYSHKLDCYGLAEHERFDKVSDSYYCIKCKIWLDPPCEDPTCEVCLKRPDCPPEE